MEMNSLYKSITILLITISLQGCSTPYYGHSKSEWDKLSEEEQIAMKKEYQLIIDSKKEQKHKNIIDERTQSIIDRGVEGRKH